MTATMNVPVSHRGSVPQALPADRAPTSPPTKVGANPKQEPSAGNPTSTSDHARVDIQSDRVAGGSNPDNSHDRSGNLASAAVVGSTPLLSHDRGDTQHSSAGRGPILRDGLLTIMASAVDDLENVRIASANRYRELTRKGTDKDGIERGLGMDETIPEVRRVQGILDGLKALEHEATLTMNRQVRKHPLWETWAKHQKGIGEKQFARLLAAIGDPYWHEPNDRPRTKSQLRAYAGYHVTDGHAPRRVKGTQQNWSGTARMRLFLITESCVKAQGPYADIYYAARNKYADATHNETCVRCGPAGKPASAGSPLTKGHIQARALRAIGREILNDMWAAAKALHEDAPPRRVP